MAESLPDDHPAAGAAPHGKAPPGLAGLLMAANLSSHDLLMAALSVVPDEIYVKDARGRFLFTNTSSRRSLKTEGSHARHKPDETIGRTDFDFMPQEVAAGHHAREQAIIRTGIPLINHAIRDEEGPLKGRWLLESKVPLCNAEGQIVGIVGINRDVTPLKQAEEALQLTQFAVDHVADLVLWVTPEGRVIYANEAACHALGYDRTELLALTVLQIEPDRGMVQQQQTWRSAREQGSHVYESRYRTKAGQDFPVEVGVSHLEFGGREFSCLIGRDITQRRRAEQERHQLEERMQNTQRQESLGMLAGGIAGDFSNLLMAVLGNADLGLSEVPAASPARRRLAEIRKAGLRAAGLVQQMLAYSGKGALATQPLDLSRLIRDLDPLLSASVPRQAQLEVEPAAALPVFISADADKLRQLVMNLVTNASEALGGKTGVIRLRTGAFDADPAVLKKAVLGEQLRPGPCVFLEVTDTGCGMDEAAQARMFDPFYTTKYNGRGLGLAAVLGIVRSHHGALLVSSRPGHGTSVQVLFPPTAAPVPAAPPVASPAPEWHGTGTVLLVDHEETVRQVVKLMLEKAGFEVLLAGDGAEGVAQFRAHAQALRAVILESELPQETGEETLREVRAIRPGVPYVLMSNYCEPQAATRSAQSGRGGCLQKPFTYSVLLNKIREVLGEPEPPLGVAAVG